MLYLQSDAPKPRLHDVLTMSITSVPLLSDESAVVLSKSAIIRAPSGRSKGVLIIGFEHELDKLTCCDAFDYICKHYEVLFMPTWQPFYSEAILRFLKKCPNQLTILPSSRDCYYRALNASDLFSCLPFHASSWIDEHVYAEKSKAIDILMLANFATYKRHILLFEALRSLPKSLRVVLVGRPAVGRSAEDIMAEAEEYGVADRFELIQGATNDDVRDYLCSARLVLGLSGREGSYVGLAEALFANAPVALFSDAVVGTKNYINPDTGFLLRPDTPLAPQIMRCLELSPSLEPRKWACVNISARINNEKLNKFLQHRYERDDLEWSHDCDYFRIQSFQFEPLSKNEWSTSVKNAVRDLASKGFVIRTQVDEKA